MKGYSVKHLIKLFLAGERAAEKVVAELQGRNRNAVQRELANLLGHLPEVHMPAFLDLVAAFGVETRVPYMRALVEDSDVPPRQRAFVLILLLFVAPDIDIQELFEQWPPKERLGIFNVMQDVRQDLRQAIAHRERAAAIMDEPGASRPPRSCTVRITLRGAKPPIWRRLVVPSGATLDALHDWIQIAMGWEDYHLHLFEIGGASFGEPDPEWGDVFDERRVTLGRLVDLGVKTFAYRYDLGDDWEHTMRIEHVEPAGENEVLPVCTGGRRSCPREDSGGVWGYQEKLAILRGETVDGYADEDLADVRAWFPLDFDPERFDRAEANKRLEVSGREWLRQTRRRTGRRDRSR